MVDRTGDWCFEGGCTYLINADTMVGVELDAEELEAMYIEPCIEMYD